MLTWSHGLTLTVILNHSFPHFYMNSTPFTNGNEWLKF